MGRTPVHIVALLPLAGCLVTGSLDPAGGARLTFKLRLVSVAHFESVRAGVQSPDVTLRSAAMTPAKWATFEVECSDIRKLSTAPVFATTAIAFTDDPDGTRTVTATLGNAVSEPMSPAFVRYEGSDVDISIQLPGDVTRSTAASTAGRTVNWRIPIADASSHPETVLSASFRQPAADPDGPR